MPALFYVPHEDPAFDNAVSYLPADMVPKPPKRAGVAFQVSKTISPGCSKFKTHFPSSLQLPTQTAAQPPAAAVKRKSDGSGDGPNNGDTPDAAAAESQGTPASSSSSSEVPSSQPPPAKRTR